MTLEKEDNIPSIRILLDLINHHLGGHRDGVFVKTLIDGSIDNPSKEGGGSGIETAQPFLIAKKGKNVLKNGLIGVSLEQCRRRRGVKKQIGVIRFRRKGVQILVLEHRWKGDKEEANERGK